LIEIKKGILLLTPFFSPNMGGVETHLDDLVKGLDKRGYAVFVQTYSPITTRNVFWKEKEKIGENVEIRRYRWFGKDIFNYVEKFPLFDFLYLTPYLLLRAFFWMLFNSEKINVIHAQGFNAAYIGGILKKVFKKKLIVSTHAIYELEKKSSTAKKVVSILNQSDKCLCLSKGSYNELLSFGLGLEKVDLFRYWIDLDVFQLLDKEILRKDLGFDNKATILFVGRLIEKKGTRILCDVAKNFPQINFVFIGTGPDEEYIKMKLKKNNNLKFIGQVKNTELYKYYNSADVLCIPSQYEEGFGRVVIEAVACGLPVIGSNKGGIPEALDRSVSILVDPTVENLQKVVGDIFSQNGKLMELSNNCRKYAEENFSEKNIDLITKYF